jgi:PmbA protein
VSDLNALAEKVLAEAGAGESVEVVISSGVDTEIRAYQGEIEHLVSAASGGVGVRVLHDGPGGARVGTAWAGTLDEATVLDVLREARDNARFATEEEFMAFARPDGVAPVNLELLDPGVEATPLDVKIAMALDLERAVRGSDPRIRQVESADYSDYVAESVVASTTGVRAATRRSGAYLSVEAIASDGGDDQTGWGLSAGRAPGELNPDKAAHDAILRATRMLGAVKPASTRCPAVFDPRTAATLLSIVGGALSGDEVVRGRSFFAERVGEMVAASRVTVVDDPTDVRHFGASVFDAEGLACRRNVLIDSGVLQGFVYDTVAARRAGTVSTGSAVRSGIAGTPTSGCRALALTPGDLDLDEILAAVGEGIFVESLTGVHSGVNPISGDFSVGVTGLMIRGGQLAEPVREATVASTLQRMLLDVLHVGRDVEWLPGNAAGQTVAIDAVAVSGS